MADPVGTSIALDDPTLAPDPTWTRLDTPGDPYGVNSWRIERGRNSETDQNDTGRSTLTIFDTKGRYDPTNAASPFWDVFSAATKLDPMRQFAHGLWNPVEATWSPLFRGFASEITGGMDELGNANVTLELADAFDLFGSTPLVPGRHGSATVGGTAGTVPVGSEGFVYYPEDADHLFACQTRLNQILDDLGWPADWREIYTGNVGLQGAVYGRRDQAVAALLDTANAEWPGVATVFINKVGWVVFHGRFRRFNPEDVHYHVRRWKAGDGTTAAADATIAPITRLSWRRSELDIINSALALPMNVSPEDVPGAAVKNDASIALYGERSPAVDLTNLLTRNGEGTTAVEEVKKFAQYLVDNRATPQTRITQLVFRPRSPDHFSAPALWALLCGIELGDIIDPTIVHPKGGGFDEDLFVEKLTYECTPGAVDQATGEQKMPNLTLTADVSPRAYYPGDYWG